MDRRRFLALAGYGLGTLAVAGVSGVTWRAVDGGVFSTGTGPAYAAWDATSAPAGGSVVGGSLALVRAAVLAANAHNTQPWLFRVAPDRIDLFADMSRTIGAMDPLHRELDIALGCALENLVQAGPAYGLSPRVTLLPDPAEPTHIAAVDLARTTASSSELFEAIARRHTNRGAYDAGRPVPTSQLDALGALVTSPGIEVAWFTDEVDKRAFADLTVRATEAIISDAEQSADDFAWYRTDWQEIQEKKDGITIDPSGQGAVIRALSKVVPISRKQNNDGWLAGTRTTQLPTASAFGALVVSDRLDRTQRLDAGRSWQRIHLAATAAGLAMQPLCQIPERIDREESAGLPPDITTAMAAALPTTGSPIMTFRIGYPTTAGLPSPRRPADDVVLSS